MSSSVLEVLPEMLEVVLFGIGGAVLSLAGTYIEQFAVQTATHGQTALGAWVGFIGLLTLFFAYLLITETFWPKFIALRQQLRAS
jgi:hypothetical protein